MDKSELLEALEDSRLEMVEMLEDVPEELMTMPGVVGSWSIKDILDHLTHWEGQIVTLLFQAQRGAGQPSTAHFGKESVDVLNQRWYEASRERALAVVWDDWTGVRKQTIRRVSEMSEHDLNNPQLYPWLNGTPLFQWVLNDTVEHEDEHATQISDWLDEHDPLDGPEDDETGNFNGSNGNQQR